jgi:predicted transcriptional regulator
MVSIFLVSIFEPLFWLFCITRNNGVIWVVACFIPKGILIVWFDSFFMFPGLDDIGVRRRRLGLKQSELARAAGVSQSLIAKLEAGLVDSSYTKVKTIFDVLERLEFKSRVEAEKIVHCEVFSVQCSALVGEVVDVMRERGYSQIPVFDGKQSVGSISERSILRQILLGKDLAEISRLPVGSVMDEAFPQIGEDAPLSLITSLLQSYSAVLVCRKGEVVGIITKADLLRML